MEQYSYLVDRKTNLGEDFKTDHLDVKCRKEKENVTNRIDNFALQKIQGEI